jgi:hypothetical protein
MDKSESLINCNTCKVRKVKCGRELPNCSYCSGRGMLCTYSEQIRRRGVSETGLTLFTNKIRVGFSVQSRKLSSRNGEKNETQANKFALFQLITQPISFVDENSHGIVTKMQSNRTQKFQTNTLLMLSTQIIEYDRELIPQIDFFLSKLELGVFGGLLKFSIHMNQDWIVELFNPSFEEKCITSYFQNFHPMVTYLSKYKFYTNNNAICPVLKSVIVLSGYSSFSKQSPELLKYLKHLAIVQLKKSMFKIRLSVCQALFIFSNYLLYRGLGKQSLEYFHQAYLMASALGIHKDMPGLDGMDKDERKLIRYTSYKLDSHLYRIINFQSHYSFLAPSWTPLNPAYQINPYSKDPNELLIAECICSSIKCYNVFYAIPTNLMIKYSQFTSTNPEAFSKDKIIRVVYIIQTLLNYSLIRTLELHLCLSSKCKSFEELEIVKNFAKISIGFYHNQKLILNSQFAPESPTLELDQSTKKLLWSAEALYQITIDVNPLCLPMFYHYLSSTSLLYINLILTYNHVPQLKILFLGKLKQVYELFHSYRSKYNMPNDLIDVIDIITTYYNIKLK